MNYSNEYYELEENIKTLTKALDDALQRLRKLEENILQIDESLPKYEEELLHERDELRKLLLREKCGEKIAYVFYKLQFHRIDCLKGYIKAYKLEKKDCLSERKTIIRKLSKRLK